MNRKEYSEMGERFKRGNRILVVQIILILAVLAYFLI
jgi:hypothetical protein